VLLLHVTEAPGLGSSVPCKELPLFICLPTLQL
jgi:hypothetical protein